MVFAVHVSTAFSSPALQPLLYDVLVYILLIFGLANHYIIPWLRHETPWFCFSRPLFAAHERDMYEVKEAAKVMKYEKFAIALKFIERNFLCPALFLCTITKSAKSMVEDGKFSLPFVVKSFNMHPY